MTPICNKCQFMTNEAEPFRKCSRIHIFHPDMWCSNVNNVIRDNVTGDVYKPYCEEVNRHGECLEYYPIGLEEPDVTFTEETNTLHISGKSQFVGTTDGTAPNKKMTPMGDWNEETELYEYETVLEHSCTVKVACIIDEVLSDTVLLDVEIPDVPSIEFDKSTNTVTINSYNKVRYTIDGSEVTDNSTLYEGPFVIDHNLTVKCKSYARDTSSEEVSLECVSIEPPVIDFDEDTKLVTITADDTILYSTDGSDIFDDSDIYTEPFVIDHNTVVKAACLVDGELSGQSEKECKVPSIPTITYDARTKTVTITSDNPVLYTTDGSDVRKKDQEYKEPFKITESCTIKAKSFVNNMLSPQAELEITI